MISVVGVNEGHNDRHMGLKEGKPYVRIWKNTKWNSNVILNDNQWHHFCYTVITGTGQTMYIDGEKKNHNSSDHSDFDWAKSLKIGYSRDLGNFIGSLSD